MSKLIRGLIVVFFGAFLWFIPAPEGVKIQAWHLFSIFVATITGLILQPLPIGAMALIGLTFPMLVGVITPAQALSGFSNTTIWLIVSAFLFAKGFIKTGLGRRISYMIMKVIGDSSLKLGYALVISDLIISPATPSNTARGGGVLFPIVRSLCSAFNSEPGETSRRIGAYLMKTSFQGNCVTSAMFITSMAANPLIVLLAQKTINVNISWGQWALAGIVPGLISLMLVPIVIYKLYPPEITKTPEAKALAIQELEKMGPLSREEKLMCIVFIGALLLWSTAQLTNLDATAVALTGVCFMIVTGIITWQDVTEEKGAWDAMIWMGGLTALAANLSSLGLIPWFAKTVAASMTGISWTLALVGLCLVYNFSHYIFASITAHVSAMYAAFIAVAVAAGAPGLLAALSMGYLSSLFTTLTHYSTGPAPIYFNAGYLDQATWWRLGFILSVVHILVWGTIGVAWWKVIGLW
ncbi:DASS family divalent anion:Na+ symporter [Anaerospora hongkongensis]|uniref:DASS family divalent anion:Na+ symporter n=1 Tax=Anaerospora hongkongensis TaxID=244830 RepID=A0A4R1Q0H6_9FIRM|nr:anion permease [Anaerospora hongkongensis]TCL38833.1 DASS family divalent anion:Na+ symporter [Anaerospora hongkongensis]